MTAWKDEWKKSGKWSSGREGGEAKEGWRGMGRKKRERCHFYL